MANATAEAAERETGPCLGMTVRTRGAMAITSRSERTKSARRGSSYSTRRSTTTNQSARSSPTTQSAYCPEASGRPACAKANTRYSIGRSLACAAPSITTPILRTSRTAGTAIADASGLQVWSSSPAEDHLVSVIIPNSVLRYAGREMERAGADRAEATALFVAGLDQIVRRVVFPVQRAGHYLSCWVQVTERGKSELAAALGLDEKYDSPRAVVVPT